MINTDTLSLAKKLKKLRSETTQDPELCPHIKVKNTNSNKGRKISPPGSFLIRSGANANTYGLNTIQRKGTFKSFEEILNWFSKSLEINPSIRSFVIPQRLLARGIFKEQVEEVIREVASIKGSVYVNWTEYPSSENYQEYKRPILQKAKRFFDSSFKAIKENAEKIDAAAKVFAAAPKITEAKREDNRQLLLFKH